MFKLDWVPRCRYEVWSKLLLEFNAGKVLLVLGSKLSGQSVHKARVLPRRRETVRGYCEAPDVEEAGELR